jgi:hypothetical protein
MVFSVSYWLRSFLYACVTLVYSTNWAQTTGKTAQNVVVPRRPSPGYRHWSERYGAAVVLAREPGGDLEPDQVVFYMGGDSYDNDHTVPDVNSRQPAYAAGYKNDVWKSSGTEWLVDNDNRNHNQYGESETRVESKMLWEEVTPGIIPPPGDTYDYWLRCELVVRQALEDPTICQQDANQYNVHWSPRRNLGATYLNGYLWVMGGRAREIARLPEDDAIGGIMSPRIADISRGGFGVNVNQKFTNQREVSTYKSDVWKSRDGETWELVTPGCRAPQTNLVAKGNEKEDKYGTQENACTSDEECYGPAEKCQSQSQGGHGFTCVCQMWSPRELHTVDAFNGYMYVVGGFASTLFGERSNCGAYACGDVNAGSYRFYSSDVWRSTDGELWKVMTYEAAFSGRGSHQTVIFDIFEPDPSEGAYRGDPTPRLLVIGGEGGNRETNEITYFNDIWWTYIDDDMTVWKKLNDTNLTWPARAGHTAILEPRSSNNERNRMLYIVGGINHDGYLGDAWMWRTDDVDDIWREDYSTDAIFRSSRPDSDVLYFSDSPTIHYITPDIAIKYLVKWWLPQPGMDGVGDEGLRPEAR